MDVADLDPDEYARLFVESFLSDSWPCGCCGRLAGKGHDWCPDCAPHVHPDESLPPWERTWYANHDADDCPFQL